MPERGIANINFVDLNADWQRRGLDDEKSKQLFSRAEIDPLAPMDPEYVGLLANELRAEIADVPSIGSLAYSFDEEGNPDFLSMQPEDYRTHIGNVLSNEVVSYWQRRQAFSGVGIDTDAIWEASLGKSIDGSPVFGGQAMPKYGFFQNSVGGVPGNTGFWGGVGARGQAAVNTTVGGTPRGTTRSVADGSNMRSNAVGFKPADMSGASSVPYTTGYSNRGRSRMDYTSWGGRNGGGGSRAAY